MTIGEKLRSLRKEKQKTLRQVNDDIGIDYSNLAQIERGEHGCNADTLNILAAYYNVSIDYLLGNTDDKTTNSSNDISVAFYNQHGIVTDEQKKEVESFIEFVKSKDKK